MRNDALNSIRNSDERRLPSQVFLKHFAAAGNDVKQDRDDGQNQQHVDDTGCAVREDADEPADHKDNGDDIQKVAHKKMELSDKMLCVSVAYYQSHATALPPVVERTLLNAENLKLKRR